MQGSLPVSYIIAEGKNIVGTVPLIPSWGLNFGNFGNLGVREISQIPGYLKNFSNAWVFGKFARFSKFLLESDGAI